MKWSPLFAFAHLTSPSSLDLQLAVQVVDVCLRTRKQNGGLIDAQDLLNRVTSLRSKHAQDPSLDDIERAVAKLKLLGSGFDMIDVGQRKLCQSVPTQLTGDHSAALSVAAVWSACRFDPLCRWPRTTDCSPP